MDGSITKIFKDAVYELQCTIEGALFLSRNALIDETLAKGVQQRLDGLLKVCEGYQQQADEAVA